MKYRVAKNFLEEIFISKNKEINDSLGYYNISKREGGNEAKSIDIGEEAKSMSELLQGASRKSFELISSLYSSGNQKTDFYEYQELMKDSLLAAALQLYADDVSSINQQSDIEIRSTSDKLVELGRSYIDAIAMIDSETLWTWAYNLVVYGEIYIERFYDKGGELEDDLLIAPNPYNIIDVRSKNTSLLFLESLEENESNDYIFNNGGLQNLKEALDTTYDQRYVIQDRKKYVHGALRGAFSNKRIKLEATEDGSDQIEMKTFEVFRGHSLLESIKFTYRILKLVEDALWMSRLKNSQKISILNIDLGERIDDKSTSGEITDLYKNLIKRQIADSYDSSFLTGGYNANTTKKVTQAAQFSNMIVNPIYKGRGRIESTDIDGTLDITGIKDLEYFNNKIFAGLRIPKPMLGWEESLGSSLGSGKMEELDKRYHRSVVRVTSVIEKVLSELILLYIEDLGYDIGDHSLEVIIHNKSRSLTERYEEMQAKLDSLEPITQILNDHLFNPEVTDEVKRVYLELYKETLPPQLYNMMKDQIDNIQPSVISNLELLENLQEIIDSPDSIEVKLLKLEAYRGYMDEEYYQRWSQAILSSEEDEELGNIEIEGGEEDEIPIA